MSDTKSFLSWYFYDDDDGPQLRSDNFGLDIPIIFWKKGKFYLEYDGCDGPFTLEGAIKKAEEIWIRENSGKKII